VANWNDEPRVRPIPVEDDSLFSSDPVKRNRTTADGPRRLWLPIVVSGIGVAIVLGSVALFGSVQDTDPPPLDPLAFRNRTTEAPDESTTTLGLSLSDMIPGFTDRLTLLVDRPNGLAVQLWDPSFSSPEAEASEGSITGKATLPDFKEVPLFLEVAPEAEYSASFDSGGRFMAVAVETPTSSQLALYVGIPTNIGGLDLIGVQSYRWHATEVGRIAWVQHRPGNQPALSTGGVDQLRESIADVTQLALVDEGDSLVRWDRDGFVFNTTGGQVVLRDTAGVELSRIDGVAVAVGTTVIVVAPPGMDPSLLSTAQLFGRHGTPGETLFEAPLDPGTSLRSFVISRTSDLVARIDVSSLGTRLQVTSPSLSRIHLLDNQDDLTPLGFTTDYRYLVFRRHAINDLIFVDWRLGTVHDLTIPDGYSVVAIDIG
jgi:hypothetical protein